VQWAEQEYTALLGVVQDNMRELRNSLDEGFMEGTDVLFMDYCNVLHPIAYVSDREVLNRLEWERR
jgi:hypothetical protein